jgi:hypothetical protein
MPEQTKKSKVPQRNRAKQTTQNEERTKSVRPRRRSESSKQPEVKRAESGVRVLQIPERIWYQPQTWKNRQPLPDYKPLPKARILFWDVLQQLWENKKLFGGIVAIYGFLNLFLVRGVSGSSNLTSIKGSLGGLFHGASSGLLSSTVSYGYLLASSGGNGNATSGVYQAILLIICSLAFIWALRTVLAKQKARVRDSFYQGMYPLIPFLSVFLLMGVQLLPLAIGGSLYSKVVSGGIAIHFWEKAFFLAIFIGLGYWSLRMITASIFALYIVTLPDMTPLRAYRSARQLVYGRRLLIWRKLLYLPVILFLLATVIEFPLIYFLTPVAVWSFFVLSMVVLPVVHGYLYNLYREML